MAVKWKTRAARVGEEMEAAGQVVLRSPALVRAAEQGLRFLLGALLAGGELFGGYSPFGIGMVACSGSGSDGLFALLGAAFGYLTFRSFGEGLRYAAACVLVFSVAFAFYDVRLYKKRWFMPLVAAGMDAVTGFVYLSDAAWRPASVAFFTTEVLLAGLSAYLYRLAFSSWRTGGEETALGRRQGAALCFLMGTLLVSMAGVEVLGLSLGRLLSVVLVLAVGRAGGTGCGAAAGVALGLGMDLAAGGTPFYTMAYGFAGLLAGAGWKQSRLFQALSFTVANAVAVLWTWDLTPRIGGLYEVFGAAVLFLLLPDKWLRRLSAQLRREEGKHTARRAAAYGAEKLAATARAFRSVGESLRSAFPDAAPNDENPAKIFDRTAQRVCRGCALRNSCWEHSYVNTFNALNDALPAMLDRGKGEPGDFPGWFTSRCLQFPAFLRTANEELIALRYRRQYRSRLRESRGAVCRQYGALSDVLSAASAELSAELTPDPLREKKLRRHMEVLGLEGETAAYYDQAGHLRLEATGTGAEALAGPAELDKLSLLMGLPLRAGEAHPGRAVLLQAEPLEAATALEARRREGQRENGDTGTWFRREDGRLFVLLCDGMGSGEAARRESALAVKLLEEFLRSGLEARGALGTVNSALALRNEESGAFTTVDLLSLDLFTGEGEVCKLGAAPTYLCRSGVVSRFSGSALPAGLTDGANMGPDVTRLKLSPGDWLLLVSDGIVDPSEDKWLRRLLSAFSGEDPKALAQAVMEESEKQVGAGDDRTVIAVGVRERQS